MEGQPQLRNFPAWRRDAGRARHASGLAAGAVATGLTARRRELRSCGFHENAGDALNAAAAALAASIRADTWLPPCERAVPLQIVIAEVVARRDAR